VLRTLPKSSATGSARRRWPFRWTCSPPATTAATSLTSFGAADLLPDGVYPDQGSRYRLFTFRIGTPNTKRNTSFSSTSARCRVFEEKYDYSAPLKLPVPVVDPLLRTAWPGPGEGRAPSHHHLPSTAATTAQGNSSLDRPRRRGDLGSENHWTQREKVDVMTFRGSFERDVQDFAQADSEFKKAVEEEDDDAVETISRSGSFTSRKCTTPPTSWYCHTGCLRRPQHLSITRSVSDLFPVGNRSYLTPWIPSPPSLICGIGSEDPFRHNGVGHR